jgi:predicted 3-demethylubiquinone-9 3-methyltransferase (glyoxalase superfamily)
MATTKAGRKRITKRVAKSVAKSARKRGAGRGNKVRAETVLTQRIAPCLWFDNQAEEAARFYTGIFKNSRIQAVTRYGEEGREIHGRPAGSVMVVAFVLDGQEFVALNGGPLFKFTEAISFQVNCVTQKEIDYYWDKLGAGGDPNAQQCGWLKDRYGLSWQVVPPMDEFFSRDPGSPEAERAMKAMLKMKKIDIGELRRAAQSSASQ